MAISERIHFFRLMRGMTQKYLGTAIGFPEKSASLPELATRIFRWQVPGRQVRGLLSHLQLMRLLLPV